jgi:hypothetical protein
MIRKKTHDREIIIDLTGPDGNAYSLMGYATNLAKRLGIDPKPIIEDMKSGDYENLVSVFDKHFGSFVTLER